MENTNNFCLILAGGKGRRLWPCSREEYPKQFLDFFSTGKTLLQQTYDRMAAFIPKSNIYVSTNEAYDKIVREQLPELPSTNILAEPIHRNTAPSVAWATYRLLHINKLARLVVVPSDQTVFDEATFAKNICTGLDFVGCNDRLLTMGVKPTRPEPGYGYVQLGDATDTENVYNVKSFTEKPDREFARMFMESGEFYWNTGLFLANVKYLRECLKKIFPPVLRLIDDPDDSNYSLQRELDYVAEKFASYPNLSIDYGILEKSDNVCMMRCGFGWADLGTWHSAYESLSHGNDNLVIGARTIIEDSRNNIIKLPDDHIGIINGLDGFIVAEKDKVLLICKKEDSSALIKKYINEVQVRYGDEFL